MKESVKMGLTELLEKLQKAADSHRKAVQDEDTARRNSTACLNNLNEAQKAVDAAMERLRDQRGNKGSDWWDKRLSRGNHD